MRKVNTTIKYIEPYSIAEDAGIEVGDKLISINGHDFHEVYWNIAILQPNMKLLLKY